MSSGPSKNPLFPIWTYHPRKFRSQTSDNMDRWKAEMGRVREEKRREEKKNEAQKEKSQKKEAADARKGRKVAKHCVFQWFVAPEGRKVGSLKRRVRSHLARWEMKNCTPLWREAHFEVKMYKTPGPDHFWKLRCRKSARPCGAKHISKSKCTKHTMYGPLLEVAMSKKCTPLWREAHFEVKMYKAHHVRTTFEGSDVVLRGRRKGLCTLTKVSKTWGFCSISKNDGRGGTVEEDLQRCIFRGRRRTRDMFIRVVRRSGRWFPERGCILEHQIFRLAEMILRDRCSTSYDPASLFRGRRSTLDRWSGKIAKRICTRPSALHSTFHGFWRKSRREFHFYWCQLRKLRKSQNCFVLDGVKFQNWGCLAEFLVVHVVKFKNWGRVAK